MRYMKLSFDLLIAWATDPQNNTQSKCATVTHCFCFLHTSVTTYTYSIKPHVDVTGGGGSFTSDGLSGVMKWVMGGIDGCY